jgi:hypothetical protein
MNITYLILAHRYPDQLYRLVDRLDAENVIFLIHIDKKVADENYSAITARLDIRPNVHFIKRFVCHWAGYGIVQASFQGLKELKERQIPYDYVCLMSGQDYPIKKNEYITSFFEKHEGKSFVNFHRFPQPHWVYENGGYDRIRNWYLVTASGQYGFPNKTFTNNRYLNRAIRSTFGKILPERRFPAGFEPYGGAQFWALHRNHVEYVIKTIEENPAFFRFFKHVRVPDEIMFQTLMGNYEHSEKEVVNDTLHFLEWYRSGATLIMDDRENLLNSHYLFARKFDDNVDREITRWIDKTILKREDSA